MSRFSGPQKRGALAEENTRRYRAAIGRQMLYIAARGDIYAPVSELTRPGDTGDPEIDNVDYISYALDGMFRTAHPVPDLDVLNHEPDPACGCEGSCKMCALYGCLACCDGGLPSDHGVKEGDPDA